MIVRYAQTFDYDWLSDWKNLFTTNKNKLNLQHEVYLQNISASK